MKGANGGWALGDARLRRGIAKVMDNTMHLLCLWLSLYVIV
jgi:hypothetical protein